MALYAKKIAVNGKVAELPSGSDGITSFNGRTGEVQPAKGDYTAEMVGAIPAAAITDIVAIDSEDAYNSLESHGSTTLYLTFEGA